MKFTLLLLLIVVGCITSTRAQQTIFDVPNHDILDGGVLVIQAYEAFRPWAPTSLSLEPRVIGGIGRNMEAGVSVQDITFGSDHRESMLWALKRVDTVDDVDRITVSEGLWAVSPLTSGTSTGSLLDVSGAIVPIIGLRFTLGGFAASQSFTGTSASFGILSGLEYTAASDLTLFADYFTGQTNLGYLSFGLSYSLVKGIDIGAAYRMSNISSDFSSFLTRITYAP